MIGEQDHLFYGMDQQDSHEFLIMLIDWLHSDLQTLKSHVSCIELYIYLKYSIDYKIYLLTGKNSGPIATIRESMAGIH